MVRMGFAERLELVGWAGILEAAAGIHVRQDDDFLRRQYLRRLGHEAHAAEGDDVSIGRLRLAAQIRSEAHTSELQSLMRTSYAVCCLYKQRKNIRIVTT